MKNFYISLFLLLTGIEQISAQTLVQSFPFSRYTPYDYFWGITEVSDTFWIGTDYNSTSGTYQFCWIYKVTKQGVILDSLRTPINSHHGMVWDGENFWIAEGYRAQGSRIFKMNTQGIFIDTFFVAQLIGGIPIGIGDVALDGDKIWFTVFSPDFTSYPNSFAYAFNRFTKQVTDTLPLYGRQPLGISVKGDTLFYVNENQFTNETERIYAMSKTTKDSLFSFPAPDPDGNCNPKGLYWDENYLWLVAERIGNSSWVYKTLYKYEIGGEGNPIITTSTNAINFGNVLIGSNGEQNFAISNPGTATLRIDSFHFSNQHFFSTTNFPVQIPSGSVQNFAVNFSPQNYGIDSSILSIHSNDGGTPIKNISLHGKGINSGIILSISDTLLDFQSRDANSLSSKNFVIQNVGNQPLQITSAQTTHNYFYLDTIGIQIPYTIDTGTTRTFRVWFAAPFYTGNYSDTLTILNTSNNKPIIKIPIKVLSITRQLDLGEPMWSLHVPDNPYAYIQDYKPMSLKSNSNWISPNESGSLILATRNYQVMKINANASFQGDIIWSFNTATNSNNTGAVMFQDALQMRNDVNGDGVGDVVFGCGGGNEFVYTLCGRTGKLIWAYGDSINYDNGDINGLRADKDFNGDGIPDVLVSASGSSSGGRHAAICLNGLTGAEIFNKPQNAQFTFDIETTTWGGVICVDQGNGGPYFLNAFNNSGNPLWSQSIPDVAWSIKQTGDINFDLVPDLLVFVGGQNVRIMAMSGANGSIIWQKSFPNFATFGTIQYLNNTWPGISYEFTFSGKEGVYKVDARTGNFIWQNPTDGSYTFAVEDADPPIPIETPSNFVAAGTKNGNVYLLDPWIGNTLFSKSFGLPTDEAVERLKFFITSRPNNMLVVGTRDGRIFGTACGISIVPVELNSFNYSLTNSSVNFNWSTATETNNHRFEIYRDGVVIGAVKGKGTTSEPHSYSFTDEDVPKGKHIYKLVQIDFDGTSKVLREIEIDVNLLPAEFQLYQNYPNPFNPETTIKFDLPQDANVKLDLFNSLGEKIATLLEDEFPAGFHSVNFNGSNYSSGIYFYRLIAQHKNGNTLFTSSKKISLVK